MKNWYLLEFDGKITQQGAWLTGSEAEDMNNKMEVALGSQRRYVLADAQEAKTAALLRHFVGLAQHHPESIMETARLAFGEDVLAEIIQAINDYPYNMVALSPQYTRMDISEYV